MRRDINETRTFETNTETETKILETCLETESGLETTVILKLLNWWREKFTELVFTTVLSSK